MCVPGCDQEVQHPPTVRPAVDVVTGKHQMQRFIGEQDIEGCG
jgi:hypothetical protein